MLFAQSLSFHRAFESSSLGIKYRMKNIHLFLNTLKSGGTMSISIPGPKILFSAFTCTSVRNDSYNLVPMLNVLVLSLYRVIVGHGKYVSVVH